MNDMDFFAPVTQQEKQNVIKKLTENTAAFGIDLGTTNSAISVIPSGNHPITITLDSGKPTMPSCVMWTGNEREFIVGDEAYESRYEENCIYSVKRMMQDVNASVTLRKDGKELTMTPAEVSAEILKGLVEKAGDKYGAIKDVVVTVPAYFNLNGNAATKEAVELAGLNLLGIIAEPTSASLCYELDPGDNFVKDIMVYDLGGGTFDVSLVRITDNKASDEKKELAELYHFDDYDSSEGKEGRTVSVICSDGDTHLGGDDIDAELFNVIMRKVRAAGMTTKVSEVDRERLILELEKLKKLGVNNNYEHTCRFSSGEQYRISITPNDFSEALEPIYQKTRVIIERVLREHPNSARTLVMVGGSTKNPQLIDRLHKDYPSFLINNAFPPDESVSLGAGIHAKTVKFGDGAVSVFDALAISIGVVEGDRLKAIIPKDSQYPVTKARMFTNVVDNQESIQIQLMQGNSIYVEEAVSLGILTIDNLPKVPAETLDISIILSINASGILSCDAIISNPQDPASKIRRKLQLDLTKVETSSIKKLSKDEKLLKKWKKKAETLPEAEGNVLKAMIAEYPSVYGKEQIMEFIRSCMSISREGE